MHAWNTGKMRQENYYEFEISLGDKVNSPGQHRRHSKTMSKKVKRKGEGEWGRQKRRQRDV